LKETDLIYEGIATLARPVDHNTVFSKETDLIYEGIATYCQTTPLQTLSLKKLT